MAPLPACTCPEREKPLPERAWRVIHRNVHYSAFQQYRETPSTRSTVACSQCKRHWRTDAGYVTTLPDDDDDEEV